MIVNRVASNLLDIINDLAKGVWVDASVNFASDPECKPATRHSYSQRPVNERLCVSEIVVKVLAVQSTPEKDLACKRSLCVGDVGEATNVHAGQFHDVCVGVKVVVVRSVGVQVPTVNSIAGVDDHVVGHDMLAIHFVGHKSAVVISEPNARRFSPEVSVLKIPQHEEGDEQFLKKSVHELGVVVKIEHHFFGLKEATGCRKWWVNLQASPNGDFEPISLNLFLHLLPLFEDLQNSRVLLGWDEFEFLNRFRQTHRPDNPRRSVVGILNRQVKHDGFLNWTDVWLNAATGSVVAEFLKKPLEPANLHLNLQVQIAKGVQVIVADVDAKHLAKETVAHLHDDGHSVRFFELPGNLNPSARLFHLRVVALNVKLQPFHLQPSPPERSMTSNILNGVKVLRA